MTELEELVPDYFDMEFTEVEEDLAKRKLHKNKRNVVELLLHRIEKEEWSTLVTLETAFNLDLEYMQKYHRKFTWVTHKFYGDSSKDEISEVDCELRRAIRNHKRDAVCHPDTEIQSEPPSSDYPTFPFLNEFNLHHQQLYPHTHSFQKQQPFIPLVLSNQSDGILWISVVMKNLKKIGVYKKPFYIALSESGKYFFTKCEDPDEILKVLGTTLGYEEFRRMRLTGKDIKTLLKLLARKETVDMTKRPVYGGGEIVEGEYGKDMTQKKSYHDFYNECVDNDDELFIQNYKISAVKCLWMGIDMPMVNKMEFDSSVTFSGDVARIMKALPVASIVKPPFPEFLVNFSVEGKNSVRVAGMGGDSQGSSQRSQQ